MSYFQYMIPEPFFFEQPEEFINYVDLFNWLAGIEEEEWPTYDITDPYNLFSYYTPQPSLDADTTVINLDRPKLTPTSPTWVIKRTTSAPSSGTTRGIRNNNWGNISKSSIQWAGEISNGSDRRFEQFQTPALGVSAMVKNLRSYVTKHNKRTIADIIGRWAPPNENNTSRYIQRVSKMTGVGPHVDVSRRLFTDDEFMLKFIKAIAISENGLENLQKVGNIDHILREGLAIANLSTRR